METKSMCLIDASHSSAADLNLAVIGYAVYHGWDGGDHDTDMILNDKTYIDEGTHPDDYDDADAFAIDWQESLYFATDDAIGWMNENTAHGLLYYIDDNCLYAEENDG